MKLQLWSGVLWQVIQNKPIAFCPEHKIRLEVGTRDWGIQPQHTVTVGGHLYLLCPNDSKTFKLNGADLWTMQRRFAATLESMSLKDAEIVDLDGYQIPIAKAVPPKKDDEYWVEARINNTKRGKQLVVYGGRRGDRDKVQMFLDIENDKITFDQNNQHPNDVFARVVADFRSGRKTTMDESI